MIPFAQAQHVLQLKLGVADIEREVHGNELDAPERLLWRRWIEVENTRAARKSRLQAPCCGRSKFRYQMEADEAGELWCIDCWSLPAQACNTAESCPRIGSNPNPEFAAPNPNEASAYPYPWRRKEGDAIAPPPKKRQCLRGVVEQGSVDGSCFMAAFEHCHEKVLVCPKDMLGVPTAAGQALEACTQIGMQHMVTL